MRTLFAALCLALVTACSAQTITYRQLTNWAALKTNGVIYSNLFLGGTPLRWQWEPPQDLYLTDGTNFYFFKNNTGLFYGDNSGGLPGFLVGSFACLVGNHILLTAPKTTNTGDFHINGIGYDQNGVPLASERYSSNAVQVLAGAGTIITAAGAGGVMQYTVTSTAGAGATNAISAVTTNAAIGGIGLTTLAINNGYGNTVAGVSNGGAFTLTFTVDFGPATNYANAVGLGNTNLSYALAAACSNLTYAVGVGSTNLAYLIGAASTNLANAYSVALTNALAAKQDSYANLSSLGNSGIQFPGTSALVSNVNQVLWNLMTEAVATNSATSNLTINVRTNKYYVTATNNITVTNFSGITAGVASDTTIIIEPQLIPRGITYPTLGGTSFGITANTNANSPMWTTLTNGVKYALTISAFGSQTFWSISAWK